MRDDSVIFEKYLDGLLEGDALEQFLQKLKDDVDYAQRFDLYKRIDNFILQHHKSVFSVRKLNDPCEKDNIEELYSLEEDIEKFYRTRNFNSEQKSLREKLDKVYQDYKIFRNNNIKRSTWISLAAGIALLATLSISLPYIFNKSKSTHQLFVENFQAYSAVTSSRSAGLTDQHEWRTAVALYDEGKFKEALVHFNVLPENLKGNDLYLLYKGICYLKVDLPNEAKKSFSEILQHPYTLLESQAHWYLSLLYLKESQKEDAIRHLKKITDQNPDLFRKSQDLLKELSE